MADREYSKGSPDDSLSDGIEMHRASSMQARAKQLGRLRAGESSIIGIVAHKVCCQCGMELNGRPRFKDSAGRYWCPTCNDHDHERNLPVPCADCGNELLHEQLKEFGGAMLCELCIEKRRFDLKVVELHRHQHKPTSLQAPAKPQTTLIVMGVVMLALAFLITLIWLLMG